MMKLAFFLFPWTIFGDYSYFGNHQANLGYTSNANLQIDGQEENDFYWALNSENGATNSTLYPSIKLGYEDYIHEDDNDLFTMNGRLKVYHEFHPKFRPSIWVDLFLIKFLHQDSASSDTGFTNRGVKTGVKNANDIGNKSSIAYGLEFTHQNYVNFYNRKDNKIELFTTYMYNLSDETSLKGNLKLFSNTSKLNYYSHTGFNLSFGGDHYFTDDLNIYSEAGITRTSYSDRKIITNVDTKTRNVNVHIQSESSSLWELTLGLEYNFRKNYFLSPEITLAANNSNNRFNEYDEVNMLMIFGAFF